MQIITMGTLKGGTGKSSTVFNIAGILAENHKVLLIDIDAQTNLSLNAGVDVTAKNLKTVKNIFDFGEQASNVIYKNPIKELPDMDIIPSSIGLTETELNIISLAGRENILKNFVSDNQDVLQNYDYILIDTNPSMSIINQNAFVAADSIILVSDISLNGIQGAELFIHLWDNIRKQLRKENNIKALVLNNFDRRIKLSNELTDYCNNNESVKDIVLSNVIYNSVKVKDTELEHKPINILYKNSVIHQAFQNVLAELKEKKVIM